MEKFGAYIPIDRRHALASQRTLPDRTRGAALFADISGFTPLTEALAKELGPRRGAEELTHQLNRVYTALVNNVHLYQGSVIGFAGDAITCWFDYDKGLRAISCALAMQSDMARLGQITTPGGRPVELAIKTAVATGDVRRFLIGDPQIQRLDILAGDTLTQMADAEHMAERGDVVITERVMRDNEANLRLSTTRTSEDGRLYGVVDDILSPITLPPWPPLKRQLSEDELQQWLLPPVYRHLAATSGGFLAELRPAATIFMYFDGIDYDGEDDAGEKLDRYIVWVQNVLKKYEGSLLQLIMGDKGSYLYAAFGAPISHGDDQARAVAAGLELRHPPAELSYIQNTKIGVSHGRMRTGAYGGETRMTYGVLGDEVNTSARLMQKAAVGQVMVSPQIEEAVRGTYNLQSLGTIPLKGKAEPLPVFEVKGLKEDISSTVANQDDFVIIGRDDTLAQMEQVLDQALTGQGQILRAEGPAGIGKSHLAYEFTRRAKQKGARLLSGACQSTTQATPYYPWRQVFRSLFNVTSSGDNDADINAHLQWQIEIVRAEVLSMNSEWWLRLPLLGDLLGLPIVDNATTAAFDPRLRQETLFTLAVEIIQHKAQENPLVIYVDDIHWMDEASAELTVALARALSNHPVLLLFMHRPPINKDRPVLPTIVDLSHHNWIDLGDLSPEAVTALAEAKLGGPLAPLAANVIQSQAQGNPFFTEELVTNLREAEQLNQVERRQGVQWELAEQIFESLLRANCMVKTEGEWYLKEEASFSASDLGLPDSIHGIVLSRLDRLAEGEKLTVKVASVIGRLFNLNLLRDIHPNDPERGNLVTQILGIETRDFVHLESPEPRLSFMFKHGTTQEVAYDTLLFAQRRELHRTIAEWFEKTFASKHVDEDGGTRDDPVAPFYPLLAYHWRYAEDETKELAYSILAGEQAASQFANEDALRFFGRALELTSSDDLDTQYRILLGREKVYGLAAIRDKQKDDLDSLLDIAKKITTNHIEAQLETYLRLSVYYELISEFGEAETAAQTARDLAIKENYQTYALKAANSIGFALTRTGDLDRAQEVLQEVLHSSETYSTREIKAQLFQTLGIILFLKGDRTSAYINFEKSLDIQKELGDLKTQASMMGNLAAIYFQSGNYVASQDLTEQGLNILQQIGDRNGESRILINLASIYHALGLLEKAQISNMQALESCRATGNKHLESLAAYNLSLVLQDLENYKQALQYGKHANQIDLEIGDKIGETYSKTSIAISLEKLNKYKQAKACFREALEVKKELKQQASTLDNIAGLIRVSIQENDNTNIRYWLDAMTSILDDIQLADLEHPVKIALSIHDAMKVLNKPEESISYMQLAYELLQKRAEQFQDAAMQDRYYTAIPDNHRLIRLMSES